MHPAHTCSALHCCIRVYLRYSYHPSTHSQLEAARYPVLQTGSYTTGDLINTYIRTYTYTVIVVPWPPPRSCLGKLRLRAQTPALLTTNSEQCESDDCRDYNHKQKGTQNHSQQSIRFLLLALQGLWEQSAQNASTIVTYRVYRAT